MVLGCLAPSSLDSAAAGELSSYYDNILQGLPQADINWVTEFKNALFFNGVLLLLMWVSGLMVPGLLLAVLVLGYKGFTLGFSISFMLGQNMLKSMVLILLTVLPQTVFLIPIFLVAALQAISFSLNLTKPRDSHNSFGKQFLVFNSHFLILFAGVALCSVLQGFIAPYLLKLFFAVL